jgi:hypothetical protein
LICPPWAGAGWAPGHPSRLTPGPFARRIDSVDRETESRGADRRARFPRGRSATERW